ncbi:cobyrinate a,c-diamide synthase [Bacillus sp. USDA818B3_A]|uniref:cobyrinate a,c-diamide synthase n=1 Tax=Bacillus sp. USDA818B3_A TaxID=2698834 RepID=UPI0013682DDF|nr:cobyrinate a,c-diamide synthase [Bacillus sp. USDA818B3_A]
MENRRLVIAGTGSGVGKTTLTIGLMSALIKKGYIVQGFKCGPDYIDPTYHTAVTGRPGRNIDSWMLESEIVKEIVYRGSKGADISIIEGVMGFFDGHNPLNNTGSTAEISMITESPVILVVNCDNMARSAAAIVKGFQEFLQGTNIVGVIVNQVGSEGHFQIVKSAIEQECKISVLGYLKMEHDLSIPERHLGLIPSVERGDLTSYFDRLGDLVLETVDVQSLFGLAKAPALKIKESQFIRKEKLKVRIAVARDSAFNFYYQENLDMLEAFGAELVEFSPLKGEKLPDHVNGLYIGGGFPEEFAAKLAEQRDVKYSIRTRIENGLPTLAECGGFMYLTNSLETTDRKRYEMVGIIPGEVKMQPQLAAIGYREITGVEGNYLLAPNLKAKGHEFHYSTFLPKKEGHHAYQIKGMRGLTEEGYMKGNLIAGYTHFHFGSCPEMVENWLKKCKESQTKN